MLKQLVKDTLQEWKEWRWGRSRNPLWLIMLPAAVCLTDLAVTLQGQPDAYWWGDYSVVIEENLLAWAILQIHPGVFAVGGLLWILCFAVFIRFAPRRSSLLACLALIVGHTIGTCSWLPRIFHFGILIAIVFCMVTAYLALPTWRAWRETWPSLSHSPSPPSPA
jgi:hypothetical protein